MFRPPAALRFVASLGVCVAAWGCAGGAELELRAKITQLETEAQSKDTRLLLQKEQIDGLNGQLAVARGISSEDLKRLYFPTEIVIDKLSSGADYDGKPGDDGVTVMLRPIDAVGDVLKVPGDIRIQLYDLAAAPTKTFIGEYNISVDQARDLWYGKLLTQHYTIRCPWPAGPPAHNEITIRAMFTDYLTKRVLTAQAVCKIRFAP